MTDLLAGAGDGPVFDAATVVLLRDSIDGLECLMLRKTEAQAFGGLWVFPGGRVEDGDGSGLDGARQAAVREAAEETGLTIQPDALVPVAHWTPPTRAPRRYLTWFFVAPMPDGAAEVVVDGGEIGDHVWVRPIDALERHTRQEVDLLPPTWMTLHRLLGQPDVKAAVAAAAARPVEMFTTRIQPAGEGVLVALWDGDAAYASSDDESPDLEAPGPRRRLYMDPAGWRYEHETV